MSVTSKKARALLAFLAQSPGAQRSREEILALLWSDREEAQGRASLRQVLSGLRKEVGHEVLIVDRDSVALNIDEVHVAPPNGDDFLAGLHLNDPAFEEWLRDERLRLEDASGPDDLESLSGMATKPSIVVLPFANLSGDPEDVYFSEGITEDIATELSRFGFLNVVARSTVFSMQDAGDTMGQTLSDIRTDYFVEGSLRKAGNRIRLSAKLVERATGQQIWSDRLDRDLDDIFALQDELVHTIVTVLSGRIEWHMSDISLRKPASSLEAYDYYLRGTWHLRRYDHESNCLARDAFQKAIELDPSFARAHGVLATTLMTLSWHGEDIHYQDDVILRHALKAVELDPTDASNFAELGAFQIHLFEFDASRRSFETAMRLNPHDSQIWAQFGWLLHTVSEADLALEYLDRAIEADPYPPAWFWHIRAEALFGLDRYAEAAELLERVPLAYPEILGQRAACYGYLGKIDEASECWAKLLKLRPDIKIEEIGGEFGYVNPADTDRWTEGLKKAGLRDPD